MSLKELTAEKHKLAEETSFMKAVINKSLPLETWKDFIYQKFAFYGAIEITASDLGVLDGLNELKRSKLIQTDYLEMTDGKYAHVLHPVTNDYRGYILGIEDPKQILAHIYTWHMGDMYGGQMIAKIIDAPHSHLVFNDRVALIAKVRAVLTDDMAEEANIAFDWAIKIMQQYD